MNTKPLSVYIHWPFCLSKCPYCDFNSHVRESISPLDWQEAYLKELDHYFEMLKHDKRLIKSIFFGGGTPSLMPPSLVEAVLQKIDALWGIPKDIEITLEANPTSVETEKFKSLRNIGINRVSIGVQSFDQKALAFLGRQHDVEQAKQAIEAARQYFPRYSFDLIYARPQQSLEAWQIELEEALAFDPSHISLYQLTIEKGTAFYAAYQAGKFKMPDDDHAAKLYNYTTHRLSQNGLQRYEVSNYARIGHESQHNLTYWQYNDYLGIGPGAHGRLTIAHQKYAMHNHRAPEIYLARVTDTGHARKEKTSLMPKEIFDEMMMMGLRLKKGIAFQDIIDKTAKSLDQWVDERKISPLITQSLLQKNKTHFYCTDKGLLLLNSLLENIL